MRDVLDFLKELAAEGNALVEELDASELHERPNTLERRFNRWRKNVIGAFRFARLESHLSEAVDVFDTSWDIDSKAGYVVPVVESAVDLLERGFVGNLRLTLHAEIFATTVDEAKTLFESGHLIPAAVLAGIVVEGWLRDEAEKAGIQDSENAKASTINEALKKAGVFSVPRWRQVQTYLDVRNAAAHGEGSQLTREEIGRLLAFAEANYA